MGSKFDDTAGGQQSPIAFFNPNHDVAIDRDGHLFVFGLGKKVGAYRYKVRITTCTSGPSRQEFRS